MKSITKKTKGSKVISLMHYDLEKMTPREVLKKACADAIYQSEHPLPIYIRPIVDPFYLKNIVELIHGKRPGEIVYLDLKSYKDQPNFVQCFYGPSNILTKEVEKSLNGTLVLNGVDMLNEELQRVLRGILSQIERDRLPIKIVSVGTSDLDSMMEKEEFDIALFFRLVGMAIVV